MLVPQLIGAIALAELVVIGALLVVVAVLVRRHAAARRRSGEALARAQELYLASVRALAAAVDARDSDQLSDRLLRIVCEAMGYENGFLLLRDAAGAPVVRAAVGHSEPFVGTALPEGRGLSWEVLRSGHSWNVADVHREPRYFGPLEIRSSLIVPLAIGPEVIGVLGVESPRDAAFGAEDMRLLATVSHQLAAAVRVAKLHHAARTAAATDPLTSLANRRVFYEQLDAELSLARQTGGPLAVAIVDVDSLKAVNDMHGHRAGDEALTRIARVLAAGVRERDLVARYAGDEFALLFRDATVLRAREVMGRLAGLIAGGDAEGPLPAVSWGAAAFPESGATPDDLVEEADRAMYRQRAAARGTAQPA